MICLIHDIEIDVLTKPMYGVDLIVLLSSFFPLQLIWSSQIQFPSLWHVGTTLHPNPYLHPFWTYLDLQIESQFLSPKEYLKLIDPPFDMLCIFDCTMEYSEKVGN